LHLQIAVERSGDGQNYLEFEGYRHGIWTDVKQQRLTDNYSGFFKRMSGIESGNRPGLVGNWNQPTPLGEITVVLCNAKSRQGQTHCRRFG
jgi:hypothetical protein